MKTNILLTLLVSVTLFSRAQVTDTEKEATAIKKIIQTAYVEGLQNEGDTVKINMGFHPGFELLMPGKDGDLKKYSITEWKKRIKADREAGNLPRKPGEQVKIKFLFVDVTGNSAVAKFEFYVGEKLTFIDYQSLYKFGENWKIVSKIYYKF